MQAQRLADQLNTRRETKGTASMRQIHKLVVIALLTLLSACQISGHVAKDGKGIANQRVMLEGKDQTVSAFTDQNGNYRFNRIGAGFYHVRLDGQGSLSQRVSKSTNQTSISDINFDIQSQTARQTAQGTVVGSIEPNGTYVWKGIPFAEAPIGKLRWQHVSAPKPWEGDYLALAPSAPCAQIAHLQIDVPVSEIGKPFGSEDCLYMNIWSPSPQITPDAAHPVMLWIHGGGDTAGEAALFDGKYLAEKYNVVVIAVNYRLGVFGWLSHSALQRGHTELAKSPNYGTTDLIQALKWVHQNVENFGGDKNRVTLFGESAGAFNIGSLLISPKASGLFHRAVMQSGGFPVHSQQESENDVDSGGNEFSSFELINSLLVADGTAPDRSAAKAIQAAMTPDQIEAYLRSKSATEILSLLDGSVFGMYSWNDIIADDIVIPKEDPYQLFATGKYNKVPVMTGTNRDESKIFMAFDPVYTVGGLPLAARDKNFYDLAASYRSRFWKAGAVDEFARRVSEQQPGDIYAYRFDWDEEPRVLGVDISKMIGASHFSEIAFVFGSAQFPVKLATPFLFTKMNAPAREALGNSMSSYWAAFAYNGNPGLGYENSESIPWLAWKNDEAAEKMMIFDTPVDQGIRMSTETVSYNEIKLQLQQESNFRKQSQKCIVYRATYGHDEWYSANCNQVQN